MFSFEFSFPLIVDREEWALLLIKQAEETNAIETSFRLLKQAELKIMYASYLLRSFSNNLCVRFCLTSTQNIPVRNQQFLFMLAVTKLKLAAHISILQESAIPECSKSRLIICKILILLIYRKSHSHPLWSRQPNRWHHLRRVAENRRKCLQKCDQAGLAPRLFQFYCEQGPYVYDCQFVVLSLLTRWGYSQQPMFSPNQSDMKPAELKKLAKNLVWSTVVVIIFWLFSCSDLCDLLFEIDAGVFPLERQADAPVESATRPLREFLPPFDWILFRMILWPVDELY